MCDLPIMRPLSGLNKEEIINKAIKIKTYNISIEPYEDCCSFFVPPHPETKAKLDQVNQISSKIDMDDIYVNTISNIELHEFKYRGDLD